MKCNELLEMVQQHLRQNKENLFELRCELKKKCHLQVYKGEYFFRAFLLLKQKFNFFVM